MGESTLLRRAGAPILALHYTVVGGGTAKRDAIPLIVGAHTRKGAAAGDSAFEMVDMRRFKVCACRLIVTAILV
jgi:hypothetical protein